MNDQKKSQEAVEYKIQKYSKLDSKIAGTDELFRSVEKKDIDKLTAWEVTKRVDEFEFTFTGPRLLTVQDQSVLLGILYLVGKPDKGDNKESHMQKCFVFPKDLDLDTNGIKGKAIDKKVGVRVVTVNQLLSASGLGNGGGKKEQLLASLDRLMSVSIGYKNHNKGWQGGDNFIAYDFADNRIRLRVNWRIAGAIFGDYHYVKIDLDERQKLKKESEKKLHLFLSTFVWTGKGKRIRVDKLSAHVWPDGSTNQGTLMNRRSEIKKALEQMNGFEGWSVEISGRGAELMAVIRRAMEPFSNDDGIDDLEL
jgi:hypothetical protein